MLWLEKLKRMYRNLKLALFEYEDTILNLRTHQRNWENEIRKRTDIHLDVHTQKYPTQVIVVGQYRKRDYVRVFNLPHRDLKELIDRLRYMEEYEYGKLARVDAALDIEAVVKREMRF